MVAYGLRLALAGIGLILAGFFAIWLFENLWLRFGIVAACVVVFGGLLLIAWRADKRARESRAGLERV